MSTPIDTGSWLLSAIALGLVSLVFFSMRYMLEKQSKRIDAVEDDITESNLIREGLKREYLSEEMHKIVCAKNQAETKLHISEVAKDNREVMLEAIEKNLVVVTNMFSKLEKSLKINGAIK